MVWREGVPPQPQEQGKEKGGRGGLWKEKERRMITSHNDTALYSLKTHYIYYLGNPLQGYYKVGTPLNPI